MTEDTRTCREWRELIVDALAGELGAEDSRRLRKHLDTCTECASEMRSLGLIWSGLGDASEIEDRHDARAALMAAVGDDRRTSRAAVVWMLSRAAVVVLVFAAGLLAGRSWGPSGDAEQEPGGSDQPRYLMLLHENDTFAGPPVQEAVAEYSEWAGELAASGQLAAAEKLTDTSGFWLTGPNARQLEPMDGDAAGGGRASAEAVAGRTSGFFIVSAPNDSAATRIASTMPHLKYGGMVQIRRIEEIGD